MKISSISNNNYKQNSVSHKAYFKPNDEFKKVWAFRPEEMDSFRPKLSSVKNDLPNHELEIIDSGRAVIGEKIKDFYLILNNVTKKSLGIAIPVDSTENHFETICDNLLDDSEKTNYFFTEDSLNISDYDLITSP